MIYKNLYKRLYPVFYKKTMNQLRTEINDKRNAPKIKKIKKSEEQPQYVFSTISNNSRNKK